MVARRIRQHPAEFGRATTFAETVDIPTLQERSERLLRAIDYYGLAELEYKRDSARRGVQAAGLQRTGMGLPHAWA